MRTFVCGFWTQLVVLVLVSGAGAMGSIPGRLESVSILAAGTGSSVAVRTSSTPTLVATTASDARTVIVELVGIGADRRDTAVSDGSGMVSRIAIDTVSPGGSGVVTRVRISLARAYRRRVRISGSVVYVDFERVEGAEMGRAAVKGPDVPAMPEAPASEGKIRPASAGTLPGLENKTRPTSASALPGLDSKTRPTSVATLPGLESKIRPASASTAPGPESKTRPTLEDSKARAASAMPVLPGLQSKTRPTSESTTRPSSTAARSASAAPTTEVSLLSRWLAITEPLQHTFTPPSASTVLARAWIPLVLKDGSTIFSYGDYAEIDDQLAFLLPFDDSDAPQVEAVSIPRSAIDFEATARASESVRAARYTLNRGQREFADLTDEVSKALNTVPSLPDPFARMKIVEDVKRRLIEWPAAHYGYRASDVNEAVSQLDPILIQLRAAAGVNRIDLSLVAPASVPPPSITFRQPTLVDLIENAMRVVSLLKVPAERTAVLRTTAASLERHHAELPSVWLATGRRRVDTALRSETRIDEAYRKLSMDIITSAVRAAGEGNVRAIAALQTELLARDQRLGAKRQDVLMSTMDALRTQGDLAAQVQLLRDRRTMGAEALRTYADDITPALKRFDDVKGDLQQFDRIAPTSPRTVVVRDALEFVKRTLAKCPPPAQVAEAHGLLLTAAYLAGVALQQSVDPRLTQDMAGTLRASAAAESLDMFDRGRRAVETALKGR